VAALVLGLALLPLGMGFIRAVTQPIQRAVSASGPTALGKPTAASRDGGQTRPTDPRIVATIPLEVRPENVAVDPAGQRLFVTNAEAKSLTIINTATRKVLSTLTLGRAPGAITFDAKAKTLWVVNFNEGTVSVLGLDGKSTATIKVGRGPRGVAVNSSGTKAYVTTSIDKKLQVIDMKTLRITTSKYLGWEPGAAIMNPVKGQVCIVNQMALKLWYCHDDATLKSAGSLGPTGDAIALDTDTHDRYAVRPTLTSLDVVDGVTGKTINIPIGGTPTGVAVDRKTHLAYVSDHESKSILIIRATS